MHHPNEQLLRDIDEAQVKGDFQAFAGHFTDDVVVHIGGKSQFAGLTACGWGDCTTSTPRTTGIASRATACVD